MQSVLSLTHDTFRMDAPITAQLPELQTSYKNGDANMPMTSASFAGLVQTVQTLKSETELLKDRVGEIESVRRVFAACERDMEDFTAAMDAVNVDLDEMRARMDAACSIIASRQKVEAAVSAEINAMKMDVVEFQEALKSHDTWMEDASSTLQQMHEKHVEFQEALQHHDSWIDEASESLQRINDHDQNFAQDIITKITNDTDQAVHALNGRIDFTNKNVARTHEALQASVKELCETMNAHLPDITKEKEPVPDTGSLRSELERTIADTETRLKQDIRQKQQEMLRAHSQLLEYTINCMAAEVESEPPSENTVGQWLSCFPSRLNKTPLGSSSAKFPAPPGTIT